MILRLLLLAAALAAASVCALGQTESIPAGASSVPAAEKQAERRKQSFDIVWTTVKEKHFDPSLGGVDWDKVREQYAPRVAVVKTDKEFHDLLRRMLGELKQSHFNIFSPEATLETGGSKLGEVGVDVRLVGQQAVISRVKAGSPADRAGLRTGHVIKQVDAVPVARLLKSVATSNVQPGLRHLYAVYAVLGLTNGKPDTTVQLAYLDGRDRIRKVTLMRERLKGELSPPVGNFPPQHTEFEARRLEGGIGYIRFNVFAMPLMAKIRAAIREMKDAPGMIIDLRGNPGGFGGMATGTAGLLETRQTSLGTMTYRAGTLKLAVNPQENPHLGPVVVMIDALSASTSEIFSAGMREIGRAVVVGETSSGAALPSVISTLPTGARFQYAIADYRTPGGTLIEGLGVVPDVEVKLTRRQLLEGRDAQLEAAIEQIRKRLRVGRPLQGEPRRPSAML